MNDGRTVGLNINRRQLITDDNATLLRDVYGYTITLPSLINTFYANLNTATNVVTVTGDVNPSGSTNDIIDLEVDGTAMSFEVNGTDEVIEGAQFATIVVNAGEGNDDVDVDELLSSKAVTVNGGNGNDNIALPRNSRISTPTSTPTSPRTATPARIRSSSTTRRTALAGTTTHLRTRRSPRTRHSSTASFRSPHLSR